MNCRFVPLLLAASLFAGPVTAQGISIPGAPAAAPDPLPPQPLPPGQPGTPAPVPGGPPAPPPSESQQEMTDFARSYLIDDWKVDWRAQGLSYAAWIDYRADGSYAGTLYVTGPTGTIQYALQGTFDIVGISKTRFNLVTYAEPGIGVTTGLEIVDQNTLFNRAENYYGHRVNE